MTTAEEGTRWRTHAKVAAVLVAAIGVLVFLAMGRDELAGSGGSPGMLIWSTSSLLGGSLALLSGVRQFRDRQLVRNTPTSTVRSLHVGDVEIEGEIQPVDEPLASPLTDQEACLWQLEVERLEEDAESSSWSSTLEARDQVPFLLDDGTGQVRVEPEHARVSIERESRYVAESGEPPPAPLVAWAEQQEWIQAGEADGEAPGDGSQGRLEQVVLKETRERARRQLTEAQSSKRRFTERVLAAGESAYVFGGARPREDAASPSNPENLVVDVHEPTGRLLVSDREEHELVDRKLVETAILLAAGIVFVPAGAWGLLGFLGLL